ncbi:MAG: chondroitin lyase [Sphingobacteriales bacterium]|nr:MAG: chondroitin lyase [Sphingobacteriales bacterium]
MNVKRISNAFLLFTIIFARPVLAGEITGSNIENNIIPGSVYLVRGNSYRPPEDEDLELIRSRIISDLLKPAVNDADIKQLIKNIKQDGSWPGINYNDVSRTGFEHRIHLENMVLLSRAVRKKGSPFYQDAVARKSLSAAFDFWLKHDFRCENWWWNEMGTPQHMINIMLMMDTDLTALQRTEGLKIANRANLEAFGARPGGDLLPIAGMLGKQALFSRDTAVLARVIRVMAGEIKVTTGRGIKPDLSFHHRTDNVISTLTYGSSFASSFAYWSVVIAGTRFKLPEEAIKLLIDYYLDGICRSMVYGIYPDPGAQNRDMTRKNALKREGTDLPENLMRASGYRSEELKTIISLRQEKSKPSAANSRFFWHSSYLVHQRPAYFVSVRMHSSRANNMEQPHNEEGLKMHHFGDGSNFLSRRGTEFSNIFPVWDWQKIPGTTVLQKADLPPFSEVAKKGLSDFSGGISDGRYGVAAIDLISVHDPLKAKKAWFFFDREYVCLGSDINAGSGLPVYTTINQTLLHGKVTAGFASSANGPGKAVKQEELTRGEHHLRALQWILHDSVGYLFFTPQQAELTNRMATGNWRMISHQATATTEPVNKDVFSLWINHGSDPAGGAYAYLVVPNVSAANLNGYISKSGISVIANTPELQAVYSKPLQLVQAVFYKAGECRTKDVTITADQPCIVMINKAGKITAADPTQKLQRLTLRVQQGSGPVRSVGIDLPQGGMAGSSAFQELN